MNARKFERGNADLLKLARMLERIEPDALNKQGETLFTMRVFVHPCGAPACALGQWAARRPSRWAMIPAHEHNSFGALRRIVSRVNFGGFTTFTHYTDDARKLSVLEQFDGARVDFCLTQLEAEELFNSDGCDNARTDASRAAEYIRNFVARRRAAGSHVA